MASEEDRAVHMSKDELYNIVNNVRKGLLHIQIQALSKADKEALVSLFEDLVQQISVVTNAVESDITLFDLDVNDIRKWFNDNVAVIASIRKIITRHFSGQAPQLQRSASIADYQAPISQYQQHQQHQQQRREDIQLQEQQQQRPRQGHSWNQQAHETPSWIPTSQTPQHEISPLTTNDMEPQAYRVQDQGPDRIGNDEPGDFGLRGKHSEQALHRPPESISHEQEIIQNNDHSQWHDENAFSVRHQYQMQGEEVMEAGNSGNIDRMEKVSIDTEGEDRVIYDYREQEDNMLHDDDWQKPDAPEKNEMEMHAKVREEHETRSIQDMNEQQEEQKWQSFSEGGVDMQDLLRHEHEIIDGLRTAIMQQTMNVLKLRFDAENENIQQQMDELCGDNHEQVDSVAIQVLKTWQIEYQKELDQIVQGRPSVQLTFKDQTIDRHDNYDKPLSPIVDHGAFSNEQRSHSLAPCSAYSSPDKRAFQLHATPYQEDEDKIDNSDMHKTYKRLSDTIDEKELNENARNGSPESIAEESVEQIVQEPNEMKEEKEEKEKEKAEKVTELSEEQISALSRDERIAYFKKQELLKMQEIFGKRTEQTHSRPISSPQFKEITPEKTQSGVQYQQQVQPYQQSQKQQKQQQQEQQQQQQQVVASQFQLHKSSSSTNNEVHTYSVNAGPSSQSRQPSTYGRHLSHSQNAELQALQQGRIVSDSSLRLEELESSTGNRDEKLGSNPTGDEDNDDDDLFRDVNFSLTDSDNSNNRSAGKRSSESSSRTSSTRATKKLKPASKMVRKKENNTVATIPKKHVISPRTARARAMERATEKARKEREEHEKKLEEELKRKARVEELRQKQLEMVRAARENAQNKQIAEDLLETLSDGFSDEETDLQRQQEEEMRKAEEERRMRDARHRAAERATRTKRKLEERKKKEMMLKEQQLQERFRKRDESIQAFLMRQQEKVIHQEQQAPSQVGITNRRPPRVRSQSKPMRQTEEREEIPSAKQTQQVKFEIQSPKPTSVHGSSSISTKPQLLVLQQEREQQEREQKKEEPNRKATKDTVKRDARKPPPSKLVKPNSVVPTAEHQINLQTTVQNVHIDHVTEKKQKDVKRPAEKRSKLPRVASLHQKRKQGRPEKAAKAAPSSPQTFQQRKKPMYPVSSPKTSISPSQKEKLDQKSREFRKERATLRRQASQRDGVDVQVFFKENVPKTPLQSKPEPRSSSDIQGTTDFEVLPEELKIDFQQLPDFDELRKDDNSMDEPFIAASSSTQENDFVPLSSKPDFQADNFLSPDITVVTTRKSVEPMSSSLLLSPPPPDDMMKFNFDSSMLDDITIEHGVEREMQEEEKHIDNATLPTTKTFPADPTRTRFGFRRPAPQPP